MSNLFNFDNLFSDGDNSKKLPKSLVNKKFDEFIKESFGNYLYKAASFNNYAKVYEENTDFSDECKELYILSEELYFNAVKKVKTPFDVKFNTSKDLYIFNLNDIHNHDFMYKNNAGQRVIRPKKQKYLCKIVAINFVKLYILIKGIYSTFNHNLNHPELAAKKKRSRTEAEPIIEDLDEPIEIGALGESPYDDAINQTGGGLFDDIRNLFTGNSNDKSENNETEEGYEDELNSTPTLDNDNEDQDDEDLDTQGKPSKKVKYNNVFYAFINAIFESPIGETETNINMEFPPNLDKFTENLHNSGVFDILCDTDYIYNTLKKNILFNPNNMNKVYKTSPKILEKIKNLETELLKQYNYKLKSKDDELKKLFEEFKQYNTLCKKLTSKFSTNDQTRVYERIIKIIKTMFTDYTSNRNKLFNEIILNIFEFNEKIIKDSNGTVTGIENNIIRIKDNITYKEIVKLTSNSKVIIYDLHISFFKELLKIFELLNEKNLIVLEEIKPSMPEPKVLDKPESRDEAEPETFDKLEAELLEEPETETLQDTQSEVVEEPETETLDDTQSEVVEEPERDVIDEPEIETLEDPEPEVAEESEPEFVEESEPEVLEESKVVKEPEPEVIGESEIVEEQELVEAPEVLDEPESLNEEESLKKPENIKESKTKTLAKAKKHLSLSMRSNKSLPNGGKKSKKNKLSKQGGKKSKKSKNK